MKDDDLISRQSLLNSLNRFVPELYSALVNDLIMKEPAVSFPQAHEKDHIADGVKMVADLISRQAAIDEIRRCRFVVDAIEKISKLPSAQPEVLACGSGELVAQPEQRWILCSERLPDADDCPMDCMVTRKSKFMGNYVDVAVCERNGTWTHEDWDAIVLGDVESGKKTGLVSTRDDDIIAWMPLPAPWKGEQPC